MSPEEFVEAAIAHGERVGLDGLSGLERAVFLISEVEVACAKDGIDAFVVRRGAAGLREASAAFRSVGALELADVLLEVAARGGDPEDPALERANALVNGHVGWDAATIEAMVAAALAAPDSAEPGPLPRFAYHPDPVGTGVLREGAERCRACGRARGWIYTGPVYAVEDLHDALCPWCIADGSAARRYDASFVDADPLLVQGLPREIVDVVSERTPGYFTWQSEEWPAHCGDACSFHGRLRRERLEALSGEARTRLAAELHVEEGDWSAFATAYQPGGDPLIHLFVCRVCGAERFHVDYS